MTMGRYITFQLFPMHEHLHEDKKKKTISTEQLNSISTRVQLSKTVYSDRDRDRESIEKGKKDRTKKKTKRKMQQLPFCVSFPV